MSLSDQRTPAPSLAGAVAPVAFVPAAGAAADPLWAAGIEPCGVGCWPDLSMPELAGSGVFSESEKANDAVGIASSPTMSTAFNNLIFISLSPNPE